MSKGLTTIEAEKLLKQHGFNELTEKAKPSFLKRFLSQFNNFLTLLLIGAALLSFIVNEKVDGLLILGIVALNALFGLYQESKAEAAIAALKSIAITKVRVMRDNKEVELDSRYLVPGDLVFVEEGTKIPADGQYYEGRNFEVNEAPLTGESLPVPKSIHDEVFMGTLTAKGRGLVLVTKTGMNTKFGHIAASLSEVIEVKTPMQKKLEQLTQFIGIIGVILSVIVFVLSLLQGNGNFPSFLLAISLAVAIVPEGLPAVMTITLSIGVAEMAKKRAIVRKLSAIEALGSITLIATDKTGTLTTNKMRVKELFVDLQNAIPEKISLEKKSALELLLLNGMLCSTANLVYIHDHKKFDVLGDPTEGALLLLAQEKNYNLEQIRSEWKIIDEQPFDSNTRRMMVEVKKGKDYFTFYKGAPESILELTQYIYEKNQVTKLTPAKRNQIINQLNEWAKHGFRVLAFSYGTGNKKPQIFLGMVAIYDPPRLEVKTALERTHDAHINVVMITGDNERTAEAIGTTIGLMHAGDEILTGKQLDSLSDLQLLEILPKVRIFARTSPFQKHRIVKLYQQLGEIVAVTGDGVNDAIALKQADVGIAMGLVGTDVARETADMILTDDNFATIVVAIEEGRNIIKNLKNAIKYLLSCNIAEAITLIIGLILGIPHILVPIQLLYINLVTDGLPALSLAFSPRHTHVMSQVPSKMLTLLKKREIYYIFGVGIVTAVVVLGSYFLMNQLLSEEIAQTAAFSVLALIQSFILVDLWLNHRYTLLHLHLLKSPLFIGAFLFPFVGQFIIVSTPFIASLFKITAVSGIYFVYFIVLSSTILVALESLKKVAGNHT